MSLVDALAQQDELIRAGEINDRTGTGGYRVVGRMIELRHELAKDANAPQRAITDAMGLVMDWKHFHNGPVIGVDRTRTQLLVLSPVPKLPDIPDPTFEYAKFVTHNGNRIPLTSIPADLRLTLKNADGSRPEGLDGENEAPRMLPQRYVDHASGTFGEYMVFRPLTQILYKMDGIVGMALIEFDQEAPEKAAFLLNPATGKGYFVGGRFILR